MIEAICEVKQPTPVDTICDLAAGSGDFLCNAYNHVLERHERDLDADESGRYAKAWSKAWSFRPRSGTASAANPQL